jgi:isocitrate dehydrogenase (NAD+)
LTKPLIGENILDQFEEIGLVFKGPVTIPFGNAAFVNIRGRRFSSPNQVLRKIFNLYANVRPARSYPGVSLKFPNVDLVVIRENTECCYTGEEKVSADGNTVEAVRRITRNASNRISKFGFEYAEKNSRNLVTAVHKANVMKLSDGLFLEEFKKVAEKYPQIKSNAQLADSLLTLLVLDPTKFDVLVCPNLFGDLVSDLGGGLIGSLGLCPSGLFSETHALFEPAHGSAPDIAGKNIANPLSQILSGVMMLQHLGHHEQAARVDNAVKSVLSEGKILTSDLGGKATTTEFTKAIIDRL